MADLDNLKDKYEGKKEKNLADTVKGMKSLTKQLEGKKESAPVRAAKQAISGFRSQWSGIDDEGKVGVGKGTPGIYYNTVAIPALAGIVDDKYAPEFAVEADKKAGRIRDAIRRDMGIEAPKGALEHFANAGGEMLAQAPIPGAWLKRVLTPVKELGVAGKIAASPVEYLSPTVDPKKINYAVGTGFGGTIGTVGEMLEEDPVKKALGGLIQKYEDGGKVGKVKSFFSAVDKAIDTLKQKKGTGEQILKEIEKAPGVKKEELELRKIREKLKDKKSITQDEVRALAAESPAPRIKPIILGGGVDPNWQPKLTDKQKELLNKVGIEPVVNPEDPRMFGFRINKTGDIIDNSVLKTMTPADFWLENPRVDELIALEKSGDISEDQAKELIEYTITNFSREEYELLTSAKILADDINNQFLMDQRHAKFEKYTTPGGKNYREVLLQLEKEDKFIPKEKATTLVNYRLSNRGYEPLDEDQVRILNEGGVDAVRMLEDMQSRLGITLHIDEVFENSDKVYQSGHFDDPNVLVHARVTDRTGPNGEKILYVEEIQSDWHQSARKERDRYIKDEMTRRLPDIERQTTAELDRLGAVENTPANRALRKSILDDLTRKATEEFSKTVPKDVAYAKPMNMYQGMSADDLLWEHGDKMSVLQKEWLKDYIERWELDVDGTPAGQAAQDQLVKEYDKWLNTNTLKGVPDAPFKSNSQELALKQILDMAAKEGYDKVAIAPGSEQVKRYNMNQYFDTLLAENTPNGMINIKGIKNDRPVFDKDIAPNELGDYIGKEKAENIMGQLERPVAKDDSGDKLESLIEEWSKKYNENSPIRLRGKLTPEEDAEWVKLLEESRAWSSQNMVQKGDRMVMPSPQAMLKGQDLEMTTKEGIGKKKIYDEIIPNYLGKYAKKEFGSEPGQVDIFSSQGKSYEQYLDEIVEDPYRYIGEDEYYQNVHERVTNRAAQQGIDIEDPQKWDELMTRETNESDQIWADVENELYEETAKRLADSDRGSSVRAFSVDVTPQMREKITGEGQKLFAAAPVVGVQAIPGMEQAPQQAAPEQGQETEETPMPFQAGGMATPDSELEEDPFVQTVLNAARHYKDGKEIEAGQMGVSKGPVTVGVNAANIIDPGTRDMMSAQALFAAYRDKLGGVDVNASVNRPAQAPDGFYQGNVMASTPVGPGRAMAGVSGYKSPQKTDVSGYNFGYEQKVGPGYASGMVFQPKDRRQDTRYDVQYTVPFQLGGPVGLQDGGRVGKTRAAAEKLLRVLHGSPTRVTPESGKAMDVTTEPSYAVKRGTDKMLGKSGPPMVNQFDIPAGRMLQFEEQYSPEDVALMRRYFNKLPQDQAMRGEEIFDAAQGRDVILEGIAKAGGFAGYERPNTGAVGKGQWFRVTEPEELVRKARGGLAQFSKPL